VYSTFCGGLGFPSSFPTVAIDSSGDAYVATDTNTTTAPTAVLNSAVHFSPAPSGTSSGLVVKFNATGSGFIYYDFLAGPQAASNSHDIAVDSAGDAYVVGSTEATGFPTTPGVIVTPGFTGNYEKPFVVKLDPLGASMLYSVVLGGSVADFGLGVAVDSSGDAYISGATVSPDFPVTANALQPNLAGDKDAFLIELNPTATQLLYSTFLGGSLGQANYDAVVALDSAGSAFNAGDTQSSNFPTTKGALQASTPPCMNNTPPCSKAFVTKIGPPPLVALSASSLSFTGQIVSTVSAPQTITLSVSGESPLLVSSAAASAGFAVTNACTNRVQPGAGCNVSVTF
ncbi:MAG: SBBP repeat-containing protein, partial [Terriglobia bacterium]